MKLGELETHPAADAFPLLAGDELDELVADIKAKGLYDDIVLYDGAILDGRNRALACAKAGIKPRYTTYDGDDPIGYVVSHNLHRRHQELDQRALTAAKLASLTLGQRKSGKRAALVTQREAAKLLGVGERTVRLAKSVLKRATSEVLAALERGELTVAAAAELAKLPAAEQREKLGASLEATTKRERAAIVRRDAKPANMNSDRPRDPALVLLRAAERALTQLGATVDRSNRELEIAYAGRVWTFSLQPREAAA